MFRNKTDGERHIFDVLSERDNENEVKNHICNRVLDSDSQKDRISSSYFVTYTTFEQANLELPTGVTLRECYKSQYKLFPDSLHYLVWLEIYKSSKENEFQEYVRDIFAGLQYSNSSLSIGSCESLCVLDFESFLYASVYQSRIYLETVNSRNSDTPLAYPPDIADLLCTKTQAAWWKAAYDMYSCSLKDIVSKQRYYVQHGLEVIRGIGNHGMDVQLVANLARVFSRKADALNEDENITDDKKIAIVNIKTALYSRSSHYWNIALGMLEKLVAGENPNVHKNPFFGGCMKTLSKKDIEDLQQEGRLSLAVRYLNTDKVDEIDKLKLKPPYAYYLLSLSYKKFASQERLFNSKATDLYEAISALHDTLDLIMHDKCHPLYSKIHIELKDVETLLQIELNKKTSRRKKFKEFEK